MKTHRGVLSESEVRQIMNGCSQFGQVERSTKIQGFASVVCVVVSIGVIFGLLFLNLRVEGM